ncbi:hypothetical protein [Limnohabitans sp. G3-2]|uniref:hypothetical protein n=1 Tax=Limnohabitans sp. G3-2 TaxID=1100711 RepID=UPI0018EB4E9D|nr:hypothetical protein [Limnohabitans sp. G3-2]
MQIHQLSVSHEEVQDRLLVRLNTQEAHEFRFWLTRRLALRLVPALDQSLIRLEAAQPGVAASDLTTQKILTDIQRDAFLQSADFATPYAAAAQHLPLGPEPLLVTDVHMTLQAQGNLEVVFQQKNGTHVQSCHLNLQAQLVHGLIHLLKESLVKAEWEMATPTQPPSQENPVTSPMGPAAYKH